MRVAHAVVITPGRCGLYETTRELVAGLRKLGIDSRMVDPTKDTNKLYPTGDEDRGALFADMDWGTTADVLVSHSGYDGTPLESGSTPVIHVAHGRPRSSFIGERDGSTPIYSYHYKKNADPRLRAVVTFWPEHVGYHQVMFPDKPVVAVQSSVDLDEWSPTGASGYQFGGKRGRINVVCTDAWRDDIDPFVAVNAFALWARSTYGAKLHLYGNSKILKGWSALIRRIQDDGNMGEIKGWVSGLSNVYRAADFMVTPHEINVRSVRESMACGCPVVRTPTLDRAIQNIEEARNMDRKLVRAQAEQQFDPSTTAREFAAVLG